MNKRIRVNTDGCVYADFVSRPSLQPGTHGKLSVAGTRPALRSRGEFVAHARVRPADGGKVQLVRRFGATKDEALAELHSALAERIENVNRLSDADADIVNLRRAFLGFVQAVDASDRIVEKGSDAAGDEAATANRVIPYAIVDGQLMAVLDHLRAWADKLAGGGVKDTYSLNLYADYTLFRPVLESLASAIWMLGPDERDMRIKNALKVASTELRLTKMYTEALSRAGTPDEDSDESSALLEEAIRFTCESIGADASRVLAASIDPSELPRKAQRFVGGRGQDFYRYWAMCSAHAHAQLFGVLRHASRTEHGMPGHRWTYAEMDSDNFAAMLHFVNKALNVLVELLNKRGHSLRASPKGK